MRRTHLAPWTAKGRHPPMEVGAWVRVPRPSPYWGMMGIIECIGRDKTWIRVLWNPGPGQFRATHSPHEVVVDSPANPTRFPGI